MRGRFPLETIIDQQTLARRVQELGEELSRDYMGQVPVLVGILKGSCIFLADLIRSMNIDVEVDFISISSYGDGAQSSGTVKLLKDLDSDIHDRDVLIVEDIVDSGLSLAFLRKSLATRNPRSLSIVTLLDKRQRRETDVYVDYVGFPAPDKFIVGYGLDYGERFRGLTYLAALSPEEIDAGPDGISA